MDVNTYQISDKTTALLSIFLDIFSHEISSVNMDVADERKPLSGDDERKVLVQIMHRTGYVWDPDDAYWLREKHGIIGAMIGGVPTFKQQNSVHGIPLQLWPEEVQLLLDMGLARLEFAPHFQWMDTEKGDQCGVEDGEHSNCSEIENSDSESSASDETKAWQHALATGSEFTIPKYRKDMNGVIQDSWDYPQTEEERRRFLVFKDLYLKGFRITAGSKFGADYLLYPGDPTQFHAQFCVRVLSHKTPIVAVNLAAACRGSFQARKHLLLASVDGDDTVVYTTFGQIGGFG